MGGPRRRLGFGPRKGGAKKEKENFSFFFSTVFVAFFFLLLFSLLLTILLTFRRILGDWEGKNSIFCFSAYTFVAILSSLIVLFSILCVCSS